jgi:tetratricopeptide (TPR) repeat protein
MSDSGGGIITSAMDAFTGGIASELLSILKSRSASTDSVIKLKERLNSFSEQQFPQDAQVWIKTVLFRAFNKQGLTEIQQRDIFGCVEFRSQIMAWLLDVSDDIIEEARKVNYAQWQFSENGYNFRNFLICFATELNNSKSEFLSIEGQILNQKIDTLPIGTANATAALLRGDESRIEEIRKLIQIGKVKTALAKLEELDKNIGNNSAFRLSILELIVECQSHLQFSINDHERIFTLYSLLKHITVEDRKERIISQIAHINSQHDRALSHINIAIKLSPDNPSNIYLKFMMECNVSGIQEARKYLIGIRDDIIESDRINFAQCYYLIGEFNKADELLKAYKEENENRISILYYAHLAEVQFRRIQHISELNQSCNARRSLAQISK